MSCNKYHLDKFTIGAIDNSVLDSIINLNLSNNLLAQYFECAEKIKHFNSRLVSAPILFNKIVEQSPDTVLPFILENWDRKIEEYIYDDIYINPLSSLGSRVIQPLLFFLQKGDLNFIKFAFALSVLKNVLPPGKYWDIHKKYLVSSLSPDAMNSYCSELISYWQNQKIDEDLRQEALIDILNILPGDSQLLTSVVLNEIANNHWPLPENLLLKYKYTHENLYLRILASSKIENDSYFEKIKTNGEALIAVFKGELKITNHWDQIIQAFKSSILSDYPEFWQPIKNFLSCHGNEKRMGTGESYIDSILKAYNFLSEEQKNKNATLFAQIIPVEKFSYYDIQKIFPKKPRKTNGTSMTDSIISKENEEAITNYLLGVKAESLGQTELAKDHYEKITINILARSTNNHFIDILSPLGKETVIEKIKSDVQDIIPKNILPSTAQFYFYITSLDKNPKTFSQAFSLLWENEEHMAHNTKLSFLSDLFLSQRDKSPELALLIIKEILNRPTNNSTGKELLLCAKKTKLTATEEQEIVKLHKKAKIESENYKNLISVLAYGEQKETLFYLDNLLKNSTSSIGIDSEPSEIRRSIALVDAVSQIKLKIIQNKLLMKK